MKAKQLVVVSMVAACLATAQARAASADRKLEVLADAYLDEFTALSPVAATQLGDHRYDGELDQLSPAARNRESSFLHHYLRRLRRIPSDKLSRANQVDAALFEHELERQLWSLEELQEWAWNPVLYSRMAGGAFYALLVRDYAPLEVRLAHVADRLEALPRFLEQVRATLVPSRVPRVHAETAAKQNLGVLSILHEMVEPQLGSVAPELRARLEAAIETATEAVEAHQRWLEDELVPAAAGDFRIGAALFDRKLAFALHTPLTRQEVRERAEAEFHRVRQEMYETARKVYADKYPYTVFPDHPDDAYRQSIIRAALEEAYRHLPERSAIVDTVRGQLQEATGFVRAHQLVTVPDDPVEIIVMPEFQRGVSVAYCDAPGPLDVGQKTFYAVAPLPQDWTDEQVHSFLREYNLYSLQDLTMHEAMPGHYLQLAHSNRYPSTLRAVLASGSFIEGWAVYAEKIMVDAGYQGNDPLMRLIQLKWYLRAVTNAILDQAIHVEGMTRGEAMKLMIEGAFQEEREAAGKWVRAELTSAQLSTYFVGFQEHLDLRREVEALQGDAFDAHRYHDQLLSFGSPPVQFVRALMLDLPVPR